MFNFRKQNAKTKKGRAQAMVEFALALPVLLLVVYGLLETGRLLFIYASTVTAARQAVRYGSATGEVSPGLQYFEDCNGIRAAVHNVGFINSFADADILISYDDGPPPGNTIISSTCPPPNDSLQNGHRINVQVSTDWIPIVPIVPLDPFTITAQSSRTILVSVPIHVDAPIVVLPGTGTLELAVSASPDPYSAVGQTITYTYTLDNTGTGDLSSPFSVTDSTTTGGIITTDCTGAPATLTPSDLPFTCLGYYTITQADLDAGIVTDNATAYANGSPSNTLGVTVTAAQSPALTLAKSANPASGSAGTVITYTYTLTNSGNVTLSQPFAVTDNKVSGVTCTNPPTLAPTLSTTCTKNYTITDADVTAGSITNTASATATFNAVTYTSNNASATVNTSPLSLTIGPSPLSVNQIQVITYTYILKNNTSSPFTSPYNITDSRAAAIDCSSAADPLGAGATTTCTGTYTVTQADLDAGVPITSTATATAKNGALTVTSNTANASVTVVPAAALTLSVTASPNPATALNTVVTYTYTLTNSGNVTLSQPFAVTDNKVSPVTCTNPPTLAPGATTTCSGTRTILQADLDAGSVTNTGTATANYSATPVASSPASLTVITYTGGRLKVSVAANPTSLFNAGSLITYTYTVTNTGSLPLTSLSVSDNKSTNESCALALSPLPPGTSTTCTGTYTTTAADVTAKSVTNSVTASGVNGGTTYTSFPTYPASTSTVAVYNCSTSAIFMSARTTPGSTMISTITNNSGTPLTVGAVSITWNASDGHQTGGDKTLDLQSAVLNGTTWTASPAITGNITNYTYNLPASFTPTIPVNSSVISFTFHQSYDNERATDDITIVLSTPGCSITISTP